MEKQNDGKGKTVILSVKDRIIIEQFFGQSNKSTALIVDSIYEKIRLTPEEQKEVGLKYMPEGGVYFDEKKGNPFPVDFSQIEYETLVSLIDKLDKQEKIHYTWVTTIRKILN